MNLGTQSTQRPYNTESGKFSYIDLFKNWNAPAQDEKYDIFEYGVFQQGSNSSVKYNDLKAVTTLDNTYLLKLFLSNSGNPIKIIYRSIIKWRHWIQI